MIFINKVMKMKNEIDELKKEIKQIKLELFKLNNPFKFNIGNRVIYNKELFNKEYIINHESDMIIICDRIVNYGDEVVPQKSFLLRYRSGEINNFYKFLINGKLVDYFLPEYYFEKHEE